MLVAITAPFFWTFQSFYLRLTAERGDFDLYDMAIDYSIIYKLAAFFIFISYATTTQDDDFDWKAFGYG